LAVSGEKSISDSPFSIIALENEIIISQIMVDMYVKKLT
jgi:hypothetical protein